MKKKCQKKNGKQYSKFSSIYTPPTTNRSSSCPDDYGDSRLRLIIGDLGAKGEIWNWVIGPDAVHNGVDYKQKMKADGLKRVIH